MQWAMWNQCSANGLHNYAWKRWKLDTKPNQCKWETNVVQIEDRITDENSGNWPWNPTTANGLWNLYKQSTNETIVNRLGNHCTGRKRHQSSQIWTGSDFCGLSWYGEIVGELWNVDMVVLNQAVCDGVIWLWRRWSDGGFWNPCHSRWRFESRRSDLGEVATLCRSRQLIRSQPHNILMVAEN